MKTPLVNIVLVNWNNYLDTTQCISSIIKQNYTPYKIILVDNSSTDDSISKIISYFQKSNLKYTFLDLNENDIDALKSEDLYDEDIIFIENSENSGFAGGNNLGLRLCKKISNSFIWLLNNDTIINEDSLSSLVNCSLKYPKAIVGSKLIYFNNPNKIQAIGGWLNLTSYFTGKSFGTNVEDNGEYDEVIEPDYINGASMFFKTEVIDEIGFFDENYFLYWEETDFCVRAKRCGWKMIYCPQSKVFHKEGATTKKVSYLPLYYYTRNSLYFYKKNFPNKFILVCAMGYIFRFVKRITKFRVKEIKFINRAYKDFFNGIMGKVKL